MINKTNDPALRAYVEKEIKRRRMEAARGSYNPIYTTPEKQLKVPKVKSAERPAGRAAGKDLIHEDLKRIEKELHNIAQELRTMNKNGRRK